MTFDNFVYWLDGYMSDKDTPNEIEWQKIKDKIEEVKNHKAEPTTKYLVGRAQWSPNPDLRTQIVC